MIGCGMYISFAKYIRQFCLESTVFVALGGVVEDLSDLLNIGPRFKTGSQPFSDISV
jgi:hypothetical protein